MRLQQRIAVRVRKSARYQFHVETEHFSIRKTRRNTDRLVGRGVVAPHGKVVDQFVVTSDHLVATAIAPYTKTGVGPSLDIDDGEPVFGIDIWISG